MPYEMTDVVFCRIRHDCFLNSIRLGIKSKTHIYSSCCGIGQVQFGLLRICPSSFGLLRIYYHCQHTSKAQLRSCGGVVLLVAVLQHVLAVSVRHVII